MSGQAYIEKLTMKDANTRHTQDSHENCFRMSASQFPAFCFVGKGGQVVAAKYCWHSSAVNGRVMRLRASARLCRFSVRGAGSF